MVLFTIAIRNLVQARRRSALLSLAIGLVTMLLVLMMALSAGINDNLVRSATIMSAGHINVAGFYKPTNAMSLAVVTDVGELRNIVEENTPNLDYTIDRMRGWGKLISDTGTVQTGFSGVDLADESHFLEVIQLAKESDYKDGGRDEIIGDPSQLAGGNTIMLFVNQARRLGVGVGDTLTIQTETVGGYTNTADVTVVAVARDVGLLSGFATYVPKQVLRDLYQLSPDTSGAVWVYLKDIEDADATMKHLRGVFEAKGYRLMDHEAAPFFMKFETVQGEDWTGQKIDITTWKDEVVMLTFVITAFDTVTVFLVSILVLIIAVGIMNSMWNAVRERTREIGTMRAIGMTRTRVLAMFLVEAFVLGLFATTVGATLGAATAFGLNALHINVPNDAVKAILLSDTLRMSVHVQSLFIAVGFLTLCTGLSALWPALRASRLSPVVALGHTE